MKNFFYSIIGTLIFIVAFSCANVRQPTGGPKDEKPPQLTGANPELYTTNFNEERIVLFFNEPIQTENLAQNFFISPSPEKPPKVTLRKRSLIITFKEPLQDNTTYTLSFNKAIKDLNEGNQIQKLTYTFSTGPILDSLFISGNVRDPFTNKPEENILLSLYPLNDTLTIREDKPRYFTYTDEQGNFIIQNIKSGDYNLFALEDKNQNLTYDQQNERIAFYKNIKLDSGITGLQMYISKIDSAKPEIIKQDTLPEAYQITYSEGLTKAKVITPITKKTLLANIINNGKSVRIYNTINLYDSLQVMITAEDSANNTTVDTTTIIFSRADEEKLLDVIKAITPEDKKLDPNNPQIEITFNYPVTKSDKEIQVIPNGKTINVPTETDSLLTDVKLSNIPIKEDTITLIIPDSTFISIAGHSNKADTIQFTLIQEREIGTIEGTVQTTQDNFILQLLNEELKVIRSIYNKTEFNFTAIKPGTYYFRAIIDENGNQRWDQAILEENKQAEPIIFYSDPVKVKANWEVSGINLIL